MDEILIFLLRKGAHRQPIQITTTELGSELGMSQQNASRRLQELENEEMVERKNGLRLTQKAMNEISRLYADLKNAFEVKETTIEGTIVSGHGEGKYYMSLDGYRSQIREKLGLVPFPGTLNIKIDKSEQWKRQQMIETEPIIISGFRDNKRTYGDLFAYRCKLNNHDCAIVVPLRTHHGSDIIEVISAFDIKKRLKKKDGDKIKVVI